MILVLPLLGAGCVTTHVHLTRSDGAQESFETKEVAKWIQDDRLYLHLKVENQGGPRTDTQSKLSVLLTFDRTGTDLRFRAASIDLWRPFSLSRECVKNAAFQLSDRSGGHLSGAVLFSEGEKQALVQIDINLGSLSTGGPPSHLAICP